MTTRSLSYDGLDRLRTANVAGLWGTGSYAYDPLDNLRSSVVGSRSTIHGYDAANRLAQLDTNGSLTALVYDASGNVTGRGAQGFYFDQANRLQLAHGVASYVYDGQARRLAISGTDSSYRIQVYSQAGQLLYGTRRIGVSPATATRYVYLGDQLIAEIGTGGTEYAHTDALGSPVARTNGTGALISRTRYEPYGKTAAGAEPGVSAGSIGFTGHVNDPQTGLVYMQQRYYDPVAGRFLSVDPVTTSDKDGQSFNRYNYANNSPYRFKDPDGKLAIPLIPLIVQTVVAAVASNSGAAAVGIAGGVAIGAAINQNSSGSGATAPGSGQQVSAPPPGTQSSSQGCIYCVKGENTSSGRDYVGSTDNMGQRAKDTSDGRNRQGAEVVDTYDKGDKQGRRNAEQQSMNDRGGVDKLDNKRNEVAPKDWGDRGIKPPENNN